MPNWCSNNLVVQHTDPEMIKKLETSMRSKEENGGLFASFLPQPKDVKNWYDWRLENWGTKWDVNALDPDISHEGRRLQVQFETAWGPPIHFYEHLAELGFKVRAYYREEGMGFHGMFNEKTGDHCEDIVDMPGMDDLDEELERDTP